jgi:RNA polymerase sigma factor (sigma-70 family)
MDSPAGLEFDALWQQEYARVVRIGFLLTGSQEEAADLAQDTFTIAWRKWPAVGRLEVPAAWLHVTVGRLAFNANRKRARLRRLLVEKRTEAPDLDEAMTPDPDLANALSRLPPAQRVVVVLRFYADRSVDQVAEALGKRPGTVRALTFQAMTRLRQELPGSEVIHCGG